MISLLKKAPRQIFAFLSSLQLAVTVLLSLAIVLAVGTFYESVHDAETAKYYVYNTTWFYALLTLLALLRLAVKGLMLIDRRPAIS